MSHPTGYKIDSLQDNVESGIELLTAAGLAFHSRGWSLATSSNYSITISQKPLLLLMTASGKDKSKLQASDFVLVNESGTIERAAASAADLTGPEQLLKPSAETALHLMIVAEFAAACVLHTHSVWATVMSNIYAEAGCLKIAGLEMLKALRGITSHESSVAIPIFDNNQDIDTLAALVKKNKASVSHGFLLRGHGLYTWGTTFEEAKRHLEALEFLLEVSGRQGGHN